MKRLTIILLAAVLLPLSLLSAERVEVGAEHTADYYPLIKDKRIAVLSNHTGVVDGRHIVDIMHEKGFDITGIFAPEHGFRGGADAGEHVGNSVDERTGIPIRSLYNGNTRRPSDEDMDSFDVLVIDIQDVGLRFYTYYVTMIRMMEACAEKGKPVIVLDRPNPNGFYVDGPILDMKYKSGVGGLPIPVVHGMTLGELATMANGEGWLADGAECELTVVRCRNYTHRTKYELPIAPSPNLRSMKAIYLYPSTCYFEATPVSLGRGTDKPFEVYGHPNMLGYDFSFTPRSIDGAKNPPQLDRECWGRDLSQIPDEQIWEEGINLEYLIDAYNNLHLDDHFFRSFFELLIGRDYVRKMIEQGKSAAEIKAMWADDVALFKEQRRPYLLYEE